MRHAAEDFENAPTISRAKTAIRSFLEHSRSVTWALQHLKTEVADDDDWDRWWGTTTADLRENPVARWFYELRNPIVKEGQPVEVAEAMQILGAVTLPPPDEQPPAGAVGYTFGMEGAFWLTPDGMVPARPVPVRRWKTLSDTPAALDDRPLTEMMEEYIAILERILAAAADRFQAPED